MKFFSVANTFKMLSYSLRSILFMICFVYGSYAETKPVWLSAILPVTYTNWKPIQPRYNQDNVLERCIEALSYYKKKTNDLTWNDAFCNEKCNFICESRDDNQCTSNSTSNTSFYIGHERVSHKTAIAKCAARGQMLVSIHNEAKQKAIDNFLKKTDRRHSLWTSGNKIADKKTWRWLSGEVFKYTFWQTWDPNNYGSGKECLVMSNRDSNNAVWYDVSCARKYFYLCECNRFTSSDCGQDIIGVLDAGGIVPVVKFGTRSYYFSSNFKGTFLNANEVCQGFGMRLVTIPNKEVNNFLYETANAANKDTRFWTSGTNLVDGKNWIWISAALPVTYTNWLPGQPDSAAERCIEMQLQKSRGLFWNNLDCNVQLSFICESLDVNEKGQIVANNWQGLFADPAISPNFPVFVYNKNSYYIGNQVALTYLDASRFCNLIGMELVSIESQEENNYIHKYIRDTIAGTTFWSGGTRLIDGANWYWLPSGRKVTYTSWLKGQPDSKVEHCIQLQFQRDNGLFWNDLSCSVAMNFICEAPTEKLSRCPIIDPACERPTPKNPYPVIPALPTYYLGKEKVSYASAIDKCKALGLKLVSIQNKAKQELVNKFISESAYADWIWTSGNRIADKKTWRWLSGEAMTESFWNTNEPNNAGGKEECTSIIKKGEISVWNDAPCDAIYYYLCESPYEFNNCNNCCSAPPVVNVFIDNKPQKEIL